MAGVTQKFCTFEGIADVIGLQDVTLEYSRCYSRLRLSCNISPSAVTAFQLLVQVACQTKICSATAAAVQGNPGRVYNMD